MGLGVVPWRRLCTPRHASPCPSPCKAIHPLAHRARLMGQVGRRDVKDVQLCFSFALFVPRQPLRTGWRKWSGNNNNTHTHSAAVAGPTEPWKCKRRECNLWARATARRNNSSAAGLIPRWKRPIAPSSHQGVAPLGHGKPHFLPLWELLCLARGNSTLSSDGNNMRRIIDGKKFVTALEKPFFYFLCKMSMGKSLQEVVRGVTLIINGWF